MRNATVFTIAPTGTISRIAGCSSSIEPVFAFEVTSKIIDSELKDIHPIYADWQEKNPGKPLPDYFKAAHEIAPEWHIKTQAAFQKHVDNSVSKTINFPHEATVEDVEKAYLLAWDLGTKGITIYRDGCRESAGALQERRRRSSTPQGRPDSLPSVTDKIKTGFGNLYVTISFHNQKPFEVFASIGKSGYSTMADAEALGRLISTGPPQRRRGRGGHHPAQGHRRLRAHLHRGRAHPVHPRRHRQGPREALRRGQAQRQGLLHRPLQDLRRPAPRREVPRLHQLRLEQMRMNPETARPARPAFELFHLLLTAGILAAGRPAGRPRPARRRVDAPRPGQENGRRMGRHRRRIDEGARRRVVPAHRPGRRPANSSRSGPRSCGSSGARSASWASCRRSSSSPGWPAGPSTSTSTARSRCRPRSSRTSPRASSTSWDSSSSSTTSGISITPLLTALGVGGLAVALALQDTLSNLFAGLNILMTRKIRPGDYVRLETGEEGEVCDITWRNTTIRAPEDNMVVVPNAKLASAIYTNTHLPDERDGPLPARHGRLRQRPGPGRAGDARGRPRGPGRAGAGHPGFEPAIRFNAYTDIGVRFSVILRIKEFREQYTIRHEFYRRLHERYREEGIKLAVAVRAVGIEKPGT
ncbi:MAG: mechanosensitive ion channel [Candidatus Moduliflexus flocculans]|nr:mechanosensitive ion channel [Candidatus Moduliflexus flocculans]